MTVTVRLLVLHGFTNPDLALLEYGLARPSRYPGRDPCRKLIYLPTYYISYLLLVAVLLCVTSSLKACVDDNKRSAKSEIITSDLFHTNVWLTKSGMIQNGE